MNVPIFPSALSALYHIDGGRPNGTFYCSSAVFTEPSWMKHAYQSTVITASLYLARGAVTNYIPWLQNTPGAQREHNWREGGRTG